MKTDAYFSTGCRMYPAVAPAVDLSLSDAELFESVLHQMAVQWSSTDGVPHHKAAMARNGRVYRVKSSGLVCVSGDGWHVSYVPDETVKLAAELTSASDWERLETLTIGHDETDRTEWANKTE